MDKRRWAAIGLGVGLVGGAACGGRSVTPPPVAQPTTTTTSVTSTTTTTIGWYAQRYPEGSGGLLGEAACQGSFKVSSCVYDRNRGEWVPSALSRY